MINNSVSRKTRSLPSWALLQVGSANIAVLDSMRAFAALSVCAFHFVCTTTGYVKNEWALNIFSIGKYGVQLFFVISGFVIPWSMHRAGYKLNNFFLFFLKRILRLEPPYLFSIVLALLILYGRERFLGRSNDHITVSPQQVALHLGYLIPFFSKYQWLNQVYWTLAIEFQYYIFIALVFVPLLRFRVAGRFFIYAAILAISFVGSGSFLPYWLPLFLLGILLFLKKAGHIGVREYYAVSAIVLAFGFYQYAVAAVIYSVIPLIFVLLWPNLKLYALNGIGRYSYSIYLVHPLLGSALINILSHHYTAPLQKALVIFAGLLVTLASAYVTYLFIEKPSKKLSASIKYRSQPHHRMDGDFDSSEKHV